MTLRLTIAALLLSTSALAQTQTPCYMENDTIVQTIGAIDRIDQIKFGVKDGETAGYRICTVTITGEVDSDLYSGEGIVYFAPDRTEQSACYEAENKAKVDILQQSVPQKLSSITKQHCDTRTEDGKNRKVDTFYGLPWLNGS